jgi:hypothetical protein
MEQHELYKSYCRAFEFLNSRLDGRADEARCSLRLTILGPEEFSRWWARVLEDGELGARWKERFADPAASHARDCERINARFARMDARNAA